MWPGVSFRPYQLTNKEVLQVGTPDDPWTSVVRFTFAMESPEATLGLEQPYTHVKVNAPKRTRTYSLTSAGDLKGSFHITVKVYRGGRGSGYLDALAVGDWAEFAKTRTKKMRQFARVGMIAYGVGITECLLTCRRLLTKKMAVRLLCANRFYRDVEWFLPELRALKEEFSEDFSVMFVFSRENAMSSSPSSAASSSSVVATSSSSSTSLLQSAAPPSTQSPWQCGVILQGTRVDSPVIQAAFGDWPDAGYMVVGTKAMMRNTYSLLSRQGMTHKLLA